MSNYILLDTHIHGNNDACMRIQTIRNRWVNGIGSLFDSTLSWYCKSIHHVRRFFSPMFHLKLCTWFWFNFEISHRTSRKYELLELDSNTKAMPFYRTKNARWKINSEFETMNFCYYNIVNLIEDFWTHWIKRFGWVINSVLFTGLLYWLPSVVVALRVYL